MSAIFLIVVAAIIIVVFINMFVNKQDESEQHQSATDGRISNTYSNVQIQVPDGYDYIEFKIAGANHRSHLDELLGSFDGMLVAEPNNWYDPNAIMIKWEGRRKVGYVPSDMTGKVREFTGNQLPYECSGVLAKGYDGDGHKYYYGVVVITKEKDGTKDKE